MRLILFVMFSILVLNLSTHASNVEDMAKQNKNNPIYIKAKNFKAYNKKGLYLLSGGVVIKKGDITLKADSAAIFRDKKTNKITRIVCKGNVDITQKNKEAKADEAIYEDGQQRIKLIGSAIVISGKNQMTSEMITYYINKDYAISQSTNPKKQVEITIYPNIKEKK